jgi:hypothetical protein
MRLDIVPPLGCRSQAAEFVKKSLIRSRGLFFLLLASRETDIRQQDEYEQISEKQGEDE